MDTMNFECYGELDQVIMFGKHAGESLSVLASDKSYCDWLLKQPWLREKYPMMYDAIMRSFLKPEYALDQNSFVGCDMIRYPAVFERLDRQMFVLAHPDLKGYLFFDDKMPVHLNMPADMKDYNISALGWLFKIVAPTMWEHRDLLWAAKDSEAKLQKIYNGFSIHVHSYDLIEFFGMSAGMRNSKFCKRLWKLLDGFERLQGDIRLHNQCESYAVVSNYIVDTYKSSYVTITMPYFNAIAGSYILDLMQTMREHATDPMMVTLPFDQVADVVPVHCHDHILQVWNSTLSQSASECILQLLLFIDGCDKGSAVQLPCRDLIERCRGVQAYFAEAKDAVGLRTRQRQLQADVVEYLTQSQYSYMKGAFAKMQISGFDFGFPDEMIKIKCSRPVKNLRYMSGTPLQFVSLRDIDENSSHAAQGQHWVEYCKRVLFEDGFHDIKDNGTTRDHGVDVFAVKDDILYVIQCKDYSDTVGPDAVREVHAGREYYHADIAVVMSASNVSQYAKDEAQTLRVKVWDKSELDRKFDIQVGCCA